MKFPRLQPRFGALVTLLGTLLFGLLLAAVHLIQVSTLLRAEAALDRFREAESELSRGVLNTQLSQRPGSAFDRIQGLVLFDQASRSMEAFAVQWAQVFPSSPEWTVPLQELQNLATNLKALLAENGPFADAAVETDLRVGVSSLQRLSDRIETVASSRLSQMSDRLNADFLAVEGVALVLMIVLAIVLFVQGTARNRAESRLAQVVKGTRVGLWYWDQETRVVDVNQEGRVHLGLTATDPAPTPDRWPLNLHPDDRENCVQEMRQFMAGGETERTLEYRFIHPDGSVHWILILGSVERNSEGRAVRMASTTLDVTEKKLLEQERADLEAQVVQAQKTEAIGRLAGGIAHDLNNLLVPLLTYAEIGQTGTGSKPAAHYFERIKAVAQRAASLTRQIMAFSRQQILEKRAVDLNTLVLDFQPILRRTVREDITFRLSLTEELPAIQADPGQVEQVLANLVVNARDSMPHGGEITVATRGAPDTSVVILSVADTGIGMAAEVKARIFEPFFTTKPMGAGTGLGLATVQGIVKQHGGTVVVHSEVGRGTEFVVSWPASDHAAVVPATPSPPALPGGHETLLVVEDEAVVREVVCESLASQGYRVLSAASGVEALAVGEPFDLLVTDVVMPGLNGRDLHRKLSAGRPGLRVLFLSGYTDRLLSGADRERPGHAFLQKPFEVAALHAKVRALLDLP